MELYSISDIEFKDVYNNNYHLAIFSSGYEKRCIHVPSNLKKENIEIPLIFGFEELKDDEHRQRNDKYYKNNWSDNIIQQSANDDKGIYNALDENIRVNDEIIKIVVDYSSMSRVWYAAILNWFKFTMPSTEVIIDFLYSVGKHKDHSPKFVIKEMLCIPGFDGTPVPLNKSIAVFGLGFDRYSPLCVLDRLEPDEIFTYLASPAAFPDYPEIAKDNNEELIEESKNKPLELPLNSIERTYASLGEVISPYISKADITLIPMGPKPHVLAAILLSMRFDRFISCMHVSHILKEPQDIDATGDIVATRVELRQR